MLDAGLALGPVRLGHAFIRSPKTTVYTAPMPRFLPGLSSLFG